MNDGPVKGSTGTPHSLAVAETVAHAWRASRAPLGSTLAYRMKAVRLLKCLLRDVII